MTVNQQRSMREALESAARSMTTCAQDWSADEHMAWLYGIVVGWDDDGDIAAMKELAAKFGWTPETVARLRRLRGQITDGKGST